MLSQKSIDAIAEIMGVTADELATAISDEKESELSIPEGRFLTPDSEATLLDNHGKKKYDEGKGKGSKEAIETLKTSANLEFEGYKPEDFISNYKKEVLKEAKIEPSKKIEELTLDIEKLQNTITEKETAYSELEGSIAQKENRYKVQALIPDLPDTLGLSKEEATSLYFMTHEVKEDGIYKNGEKLKDSLQNDLSQEEAVKAFISEKGWSASPSGRGGGAGGGGGANPGKITTMEEFEAVLKEKNLPVGSQEAQALLAEAAKENPSILDE